MVETDETRSFLERLGDNEDGLAYLVVGVVAVVLSPFLAPIVAPFAVFCGVNLYQREGRRVAGGLIAVTGSVAFALWLSLLLSGGL